MELTRTIDGFPKTNQMKKIIVREATDFGDDYKVPRVPNYIQKNIAKNGFISVDRYITMFILIEDGYLKRYKVSL